MIQAKTYYCGRNGGVRKLVDLTAPWIDVSLPTNGIPAALQAELFDVEVDPNDGDKVFVVGGADCGINWYGIGVSSNGGTTWQIPGGNYQAIIGASGESPCFYKWYEVSIVDSTTSYVCGQLDTLSGKPILVKSTDGGLTFNTCTPFPVEVDGMDATCLHFTTPLIGVVSFSGLASTANYVLRTMDGGNTWLVMNGGLPLSTSNPFPGTGLPVGPITGIFMADDLGYIVGIGQNMIIETTVISLPNPPASAGVGVDSWQNNFYTSANGFSNIPIGYHVSYLRTGGAVPNDAIISVSGYSSLGIDSSDRGATWNNIPAPGYDPTNNGFNRIAAHFYRLNNSLPNTIHSGFYNKDADVYHNINGFAPFSETFSDNSPYGVNAIWTWYLETPTQTCYLLTNCNDPSDTIVTSTNLAANVGQVTVVIGYSACYIISVAPDCVGAIPVTVVTMAPDCTGCSQTCYLLEDCAGNVPDVVTSVNLSIYVGQIITVVEYPGICWTVSQTSDCSGSIVLALTVGNNFPDCISCSTTCYYVSDCSGQFPTIHTYTDLSAFVGQTITLNNYPGICWMVIQAPNCTGSVVLGSTVTNTFVDCPACLKVCYRLVDCTGTKPDIITDTDLSAFVNQVIKIVGCDSVCYIVTNSTTCQDSEVIEMSTSFGTCELCLEAPRKSLAPLKARMIQPNYGEGECSVEFVERVNCKFSNQVYAKLLTKKYGVNPCIDDELDKWLIKKQLLNLNLIYDPNACIVPPTPEMCPEVPVVPPTPNVCGTPTNVVVTISDPLPVSCGTPTIIDVEIVYQAP